MKERILELIATQFNREVEELDEDMSFVDDLNADSIDIVEFVMTIEDELDLEIDDEVIEKMSTIGDVIDYIEELE
ncbi:acyl carrier protein [Anaerosphaera multitolerans]|uniref:Acyl carrier protein n=1 Tax=Anaerosphaera multitolerans TaxID=2487351 RepID=A0A437S888_9FIRM|nr:acyl carrier protein [Anaerosphaera multitolerans]RVU55300.1 acyl carrier protein [Anaerosphaera multitolerans]